LGIVIQQAVRSTIYSYVGAFLGFLTVWFMNRLWLSTEQNGLLNLLISISLLTGSLSNLGMAGVTTRMFPKFRDHQNKHNGFLFYPIIITTAGFIFFLGLFFLFRDQVIANNLEKSRLFADNIYYLIPLTFFIAYFYIFDAYSRSIYLTTAGVVIKEVLLRIVILIAAYLYHIHVISFDLFVLIYCISFCAMSIALLIYLQFKKEFHPVKASQSISPKISAEMKQVAIFSIITGLSSLLISSLDKLIVNDIMGIGATGVFAVATYFGSIIQIPARSIGRISSSVIADGWQKNDIENIQKVYHKTCLNQMTIGLLILLGIAINLDSIISLMPTEYAEAKYVILFMAIGYLIDMATGVNGIIIGTSRYFRYDTYFMILLVIVTVITNYLFIPRMGIAGAGLASCITYFTFNLLRYLFIWKKFGLQPYDFGFVKILAFAAISFIVVHFMPSVNQAYYDIIIRGSLICSLFAALVFWSGLTPDINNTVKGFMKGRIQ
jgi:O-antigen/teichoic acid export membrane protein